MKLTEDYRDSASPPLANYFSDSEDSGEWAELEAGGERAESSTPVGHFHGHALIRQTPGPPIGGFDIAPGHSATKYSPPPPPVGIDSANKQQDWSPLFYRVQNQTVSMESIQQEWIQRQQSRIANNGGKMEQMNKPGKLEYPEAPGVWAWREIEERGDGDGRASPATTTTSSTTATTRSKSNSESSESCGGDQSSAAEEELNTLRLTVGQLHKINEYLFNQNQQLFQQNLSMANFFGLLQQEACAMLNGGHIPMHPMATNFFPPLPPAPAPPIGQCQVKSVVNSWNSADCHQDIVLASDGLTVLKSGIRHEFGSVRAKYPISNCGAGGCTPYFEIKVVAKPNRIWIGLSSKKFKLHNSLGFRKTRYSFSFTSYGGFWACGVGQEYGRRFDEDDVVGCGLNMDSRELFFTLNGENLGTARTLSKSEMGQELYPTITLCGSGALVGANFADFKMDFQK